MHHPEAISRCNFHVRLLLKLERREIVSHYKSTPEIPGWVSNIVRKYGWLAFVLPFMQSLTVKSLGIVFGDIGTSPLYAENVAYSLLGGHPSNQEVIGVVSTIVWSLIIIPFLWYSVILMRTDFHGEGGTTALTSRLMRKVYPMSRTNNRRN